MYRRTRLHPGWLLTALLGVMFMGNIDLAISNIAMPSIRDSLSASGSELELMVSGYTLAYAIMLIPGSRLGDMYGYRRLVLLGLGVFTLASVLSAFAPSTVVLVLARIIQGAGAALMTSQVLTGIRLNFEGHAHVRALGLYTAVLSGSAVIGQVFGGALIEANLLGMGWRPIFLINLPIGIFLMIVVTLFLPDRTSKGRQRMDIVGVLILTAALLLLTLPLTLGQDKGWPEWVWLSLAASIPAFVAFALRELRLAKTNRAPLINVRILAHRSVGWGVLSQAMAKSTYNATLFVLALYLQQGLGKSPLYSGNALISWVAAFGLVGPLLSKLRSNHIKWVAPVGGWILAVSFAGIGISLLNGMDSGTPLFVLLGLGGLGLGTGFSGMLNQLTSSIDRSDAADLTGIFNTVQQVSGVIGVAIFGTAYLGFTSPLTHQAAISGFIRINFALSATAALAALLAHVSIRARVEVALPDSSWSSE